jgi:hypothetical protein
MVPVTNVPSKKDLCLGRHVEGSRHQVGPVGHAREARWPSRYHCYEPAAPFRPLSCPPRSRWSPAALGSEAWALEVPFGTVRRGSGLE